MKLSEPLLLASLVRFPLILHTHTHPYVYKHQTSDITLLLCLLKIKAKSCSQLLQSITCYITPSLRLRFDENDKSGI